MKKVVIFIVIIAIIVAIAFSVYKKMDDYNQEPGGIINEMAEENLVKEIQDTVIIKNGDIQNENLIDEFLGQTSRIK